MKKMIFTAAVSFFILGALASAQDKTRISVFPFENKGDAFYDWMGYGLSYLTGEVLEATGAMEFVPMDSIYNAELDPNINLKNIYEGTVSPSFQLYHANWKTGYALLGNFTVNGDTAIEINYKFSILQRRALSQVHTVNGKFGKYTDVYLTYLKYAESLFADMIGFNVTIDRAGVIKGQDKLRSRVADYDGLQVYIKKWLAIKHYEAAIRFTEEKSYDNAIRYFGLSAAYDEYQTLNIAENLAKTYVLRGTAAYNDKNRDAAEKDYLKAIETDPKNADAYYNLGNVYKEKEKWDDAEQNYQKALTISPDMTAAYVNLGYIFNQQGDFNSAVKSYEKAGTLDTKNPQILYFHGVALDNLGETAPAKAKYEEALSLDSTIAGAHLNLGIIYKQMKDLNRAQKHYQRALTYDPGSALAHRNLGILLMNNKKEAAQAVFHLEKTLELEPDQDDAGIIKKNIEILKKKLPKKKKK